MIVGTMPGSTQTTTEKKATAQWRCLACLKAQETESSPATLGPWKCEHCGEERPARPEAVNGEGVLVACPVCSCPDIYRQRDFNRALGIGIIVAGILIGLASRSFLVLFLMLNLVAAIDFAIYRLVREIVICYHCQAIFGNYPGTKEVPAFDLDTSDKYIEIERERGW